MTCAYVESTVPLEPDEPAPFYYATCGECGWASTRSFDLLEHHRARREADRHRCRRRRPRLKAITGFALVTDALARRKP